MLKILQTASEIDSLIVYFRILDAGNIGAKFAGSSKINAQWQN